MPLAHHVACKPVSSSCLELLIDRFGTGCLTYGNGRLIRETPVHLAAQHQDESWMKLVKEKGGRGCLRIANEDGKTVAHFAAMNRKSNSCLKWLVKELGSDCLTVPDKYGDTAVHLAAQHQGIESLEWIKRQIGTDCFRLKGRLDRTAFHFAAKKSDNSNLKWLVKELGNDCLTVPDSYGNTAVHLAAKHQGIESLEWIKRQIGADCFRLKGWLDKTAFHFAAEKSDNSNLKWLVKELGSHCLTVPDEYGNTAVHLAARHQPVDSLQFIFDQIGAEMFSLKNNRGETPADVVASRWCYADQSEKRDWISSTQRRLEASRPPAGSSAPTAASAGAKKQLDPSFTDWDFILQDNKKQLIGRGGFGEVYKALTDRNQTVAVKVLPLSGTGQSGKLQKAVEMEKRGVEIIKRLSHPNILQFLKCEQKSDGLYIFTELVSGHSLFELMQRQNKPFKESGVRDFSRQICSGLNFLHCQPEGAILHRDIKSSNIMLTNEGVIKLIDFGLAKEIVGTCGLSTGVDPKGTPYFMAPELFMGEGDSIPYSAKTDVWAFGCTVYELTAMEPPDANVPQIRIG
uniref:Protein kinase domain-containing protein n=2 Tax=Macrostomum lignano TaxID=282301 RepID=A0A1I8HEL3_9PLAT